MIKKIIIAVVIVGVVGAGLWFGKKYIPAGKSTKGELKVISQPASTVFVNGENKGKVPATMKVEPAEYTVKLVPDDEATTATFEQKVKVNAGMQTYINVSMGVNSLSSAWEVVTLEKIKGSETEIAIFSQTDASEVTVDGERKGTTPLSFTKIGSGSHEIKLTAAGFGERIVLVKVTPGFKLTISAQLPLVGEPAATASGSAGTQPIAKTMVTIKETETGWLRVRKDASKTSEELTKVKPGEQYALIEEKDNWYKIEYKEGEEGWISAAYAEKVQ